MRKSPIILFSMFLIILSLLFINSIDTYGDESWETYDGNEYNFKKHTQGGDYYSEITGYEGTTDTLIIEASLEGYAVSILSDNSFSGSSFSIVVVPRTVKTIDNNAFSNCNNLEAIYFLGEMPAIDSNAIPTDVDVFYNPIFSDTWTIGSPFTVIDNNGVKYCLIGDEAYVLGRSENSKNITISSKVSIESEEYEVKKILPYSFFKDEVLVSVVIEEGITIIEERAFMYCSNLKSITFPSSLRIIDAESFRMDIPLNKESSYSSLIELNIPNGVEYLGFECFRMNCLLKEITIPDSVTSLKEGALRGCFKVENVVIGSNVTEISDWMLDNCYKLKSVTFKGNISSIGASAFTEDESLENLIFQGDCPEFVGASAFSGCLLLKSFPFQTLRNIGITHSLDVCH